MRRAKRKTIVQGHFSRRAKRPAESKQCGNRLKRLARLSKRWERARHGRLTRKSAMIFYLHSLTSILRNSVYQMLWQRRTFMSLPVLCLSRRLTLRLTKSSTELLKQKRMRSRDNNYLGGRLTKETFWIQARFLGRARVMRA